VPFAAKTAAGQFGHAHLLRRTGGGLPQPLVLIKSIELAHNKPGTIISIYSVLLPYISRNTEAQVNPLTLSEILWHGWLHLIWMAPC
jgi:hypothetical protein